MEPVKYFYESNGNRDLDEDKQGYAMIGLLSARDQSAITDYLVGKSIQGGKKVKVEFASKSLEINRKKCPKVFNVMDPFTDEIHAELSITQVYNMSQFKDLYEELSNAVGDLEILKDGLKKT